MEKKQQEKCDPFTGKKWIGTVLEQLQMMNLLDKDFKWTTLTMLRELKETIYKDTAASGGRETGVADISQNDT